jgi:hypothetical protein
MTSRDSAVDIATRLRAWSGFQDSIPDRVLEFIFSPPCLRPALGSTQPSIQWVPWALSLGVKRPGGEAEVKNGWSYNSIPSIRFHDVVIS